MRTRFIVLLVASCVFMGSRAYAQWVTQEQALTSGWNSVYLYVQPSNPSCDALFAGLPIEQVCAFNDVFSSVEYTVDPTDYDPNGTGWLQWCPSTNVLASSRNLYQLQVGKGYLIKVSTGSSVTLRITGVPECRPVVWRENRYNLVGFLVNTNPAPTFAEFFSGSNAHTGKVYRLEGGMNATWAAISRTERMRPGEAFWIYVAGASQFQGPLEFPDLPRAGLDYGDTLQELALNIRNAGSTNRTVTITYRASSPPVAGSGVSMLAGVTPLSWWDLSGGAWGQWRNFASNVWGSVTRVLTNGEETAVQFAVRRQDMAPFQPPPGETGHYAGVLEVLSGGARALIPVQAQGVVLPGVTSVVSRARAGLWVGSLLVEEVSQAVASDTQTGHNPTNPLPVDADAAFPMRLIVHLDTNEVVRLLPEVNLFWKDGLYATDGDGISKLQTPGRYALITRRDLLPEFKPAAGQEIATGARRISSALFSGTEALVMARGTNATVNSFAAMIDIGYNDPSNPYKHAFHPAHDNLQPSGTWLPVHTNAAGLTYTTESFSIRRQIVMTFAPADQVDPSSTPSYGDNVLAGCWDETVTGLRTQAIVARGRFMLRKVSDVGVLNDGR